ncbi:tRNA preQ1(34) S-adenosylmethionine ribosyltransferase-isomerase QueA [Limisphaera ngatamarikiensis]|jgi:S-adenosylmethionine:tRNA ribosyltransferase-isomerase|uniref:S-adenosylmethionine:tRNA ribosyltransferase-isomerase n=1 Tax=Limisphaera ngatamarikiensis TaxID=1324935 RepID=A0A6M1RTI4_9BACT|nr:tRNA preQ1(34) S-adenosylmethionine ribosyltransferase-isomerase QueA [Limisphaera ngatamarikiensis]NGO38082.1 tRNA preQ1(34) S-adenosylmethionine ribosyltransferase-isomerase QueA [Limisphaera ngatamarikiensis]
MRVEDFHYELPPELIAQHPADRRDASRLLVLHRTSGRREHRRFTDLPDYLRAGDVLVLNDSRVIPARLLGRNQRTGGAFEILLLEPRDNNVWQALLRPGKRARRGTCISVLDHHQRPSSVWAEVLDKGDGFEHTLRFHGTENLLLELDRLGHMPLPPYIQRQDGAEEVLDRERYQTVYARVPGSAAAPTAGLHFTQELLEKLRSQGVTVCFVTLHVGLGTFAPVRVSRVEEHVMHEERFELSEETAHILQTARAEGRRIVAVGTTTVRVLETVANWFEGRIQPTRGRTRLFIYPPYQFRAVDALITNFHLPGSTLLMLVSAFAAPGETRGRELILETYAEAVRERYRFFSYGDAMLIL